MTQYAKFISSTEVQYPTAAEFEGVINWQSHDSALRAKGYCPLINEPEQRVGATPTPSRYEYTHATTGRVEPRPVEVPDYEEDPETGEQRQTGTHIEWIPTTIEIDASYITVTDWDWVPIPTPEPEPLPTVFAKSEVLAALQGCGYYEQAFAVYQQSVELQLFWATYLEIDIQHPATVAVIEQLGLPQQVIDQLRQWVVEARKRGEVTVEA